MMFNTVDIFGLWIAYLIYIGLDTKTYGNIIKHFRSRESETRKKRAEKR